ncbi:hypothetical protein CFIMG_007626RA00001 [Ceratocystis fimbriata CBS 114723]|uniref:Uncharacterized protein n=1 Tax=Ceratocystis fimbriata CBS 114723 TaxID=1035309 RepID=A0A2C5XDS9_9PEZI|nr:hypothetical protein CFIMG_007626RA00001 [Ceratocystis fimbriata CBS 114723]
MEAYSLRYTIADDTIYVPAKLRVSMILAVAMILGVVYLWLSIKSASNGRFGNYVSMFLLLAGAVLGIGPSIMRRGWTYYDFVRWWMPIRGTSELGLHAYFIVLTVAKTYGVHISGRYTHVFPDSYRSSGGSLNVDVPIRLYDVQQSDTVVYGLDYDGTLVVQLHDKMTHLYSNNLNLPSTQIIETDPLADFDDGADARYKLQNILLG